MPRLLPLVLLLAVAACDSQAPVRAPLSLDPGLDSLTRVDAGVLALRYTLAVDKDSTTIELDPALVDALYRAVGTVRASEHADLVDGIRTFPYVPANQIYLATDSSIAWTAAWKQGEVRTGVAPIDALVADRGFTLQAFHETRWYDMASFVSDRPFNTVALGRALEAHADVRFAGPDGWIGDGHNIEAERRDGGWRLDFSRGSGDCPAGCIHREYWTFQVDADESVTYLGTRTR